MRLLIIRFRNRIYQDYYSRSFLSTDLPSTISWIGSIQVFFLYAGGTIGGPLFDRYGARVSSQDLNYRRNFNQLTTVMLSDNTHSRSCACAFCHDDLFVHRILSVHASTRDSWWIGFWHALRSRDGLCWPVFPQAKGRRTRINGHRLIDWGRDIPYSSKPDVAERLPGIRLVGSNLRAHYSCHDARCHAYRQRAPPTSKGQGPSAIRISSAAICPSNSRNLLHDLGTLFTSVLPPNLRTE